MNKKGFTLVELLAVIVILGLLGTIGAFAYTNITGKTKNKVYETYEKTMKDGAMMYVLDNGANNMNLSLSTLVENKYIDLFISPEKNDNCNSSYVEIRKNASYEINYKVCLICNNYKSSGC